MSREPDVNVVGGELQPCSSEPLTGFFRNGCCSTGPEDAGSHTVCVVLTAEFLDFEARRERPLDAAARVGVRGDSAGRPLVPVRVALARGVRGRAGARGRARRDARPGARGRADRGAHVARRRARSRLARIFQ